jgi:diguanylate cyclase (GGDEF)-like protein
MHSPSAPTSVLRCLWRVVVCLGLGLLQPLGLWAQPVQTEVLLDAHSWRQDLWPAVQILPDASARMGLAQVQAAAADFAPPQTARSTLGIRAEPVWLRIPVRLAPSAGPDWALELDYPMLNRLDIYLVRDGQVVQQALLGNLQHNQARPRSARSPTMALRMQPDQAYTLYIRVQSQGAMVLPITLNTQAAYLEHALREQMLQGLMLGLSLCLLMYGVTHWLGVRDPLFLKYALIVVGGLVFSLLQFGVGVQYVWPGNLWLELHLAALSALASTCGFFLFFEHVLAGPGAYRHFSQAMRAGALASLLVGLAYALDLLGKPVVNMLVGLLGILPPLLAMPPAWRRARHNSATGIYLVLGALVYFVAALTLVGVIQGRVAVNFWTLHSVQWATLLDLLMLMRLLALRSRATQAKVVRVTQERDAMHSLAHTDPLTDLPNRRGLSLALDQALAQCSPHSLVAVYVLDLDGFKPVNDQYGHDVGDLLLTAVALRLQALVRSSDLVSRMGGDEFVIVARGLHSDRQAQDLGHKLLEAFQTPVDLEQHRFQVGLTIGYALAPLDGMDAKVLLKLADAGMYQGKQEGKHCLRRFDSTRADMPEPSLWVDTHAPTRATAVRATPT